MNRFAGVTLLMLGMAVVTVGCGEPSDGEHLGLAPGLADPANAGAVAQGETVYLAHCASCHGMHREGQPNWQEPLPDGGYPAPPHDGSGHSWRHSDRQLFEATKFAGELSATPGTVSHMPAFENVLSDDEIWAVIAFIKSHWPAELLARQRLLTRMRSPRDHAGHEAHIGRAGEPAG